MIFRIDCPVTNPKAAARSAGRVHAPSLSRHVRAVVACWALLLPASAVSLARGATQLTPFQGSADIVAGRNVAGPQGASYRLPGGIVVTLSPNCEGSVIAQPQMLALKAGKRTPTYSVFLNSGKVDVVIPTHEAGAVLIAAPMSVRAIAQRGSVTALVTGRNVYAYSADQALLVSQKERLSTLAAGIVRHFTPDTAPADRPALAAPQWETGRHVWLALPSDDAKISGFSFSSIPGAHSYAVQLIRQSDGLTLANFATTTNEIKEGLPRLTSGNYHLVARAIDNLGLPGKNSAAFKIQVVGVDVPPGANLKPDARIELLPTQKIQLNNAAGLSMTRSNERVKRSASEPVGISNGKPTPVIIQDEDAAPPCLVWLLPSKVPVVALAGPKWVVWPQQSVSLEVRWTDALGNHLANEIEPVVNVFVGIEPVDVVWEKRPDYWRATLGPQPGNGPWVVRLEVRDQQGGLLARDFVEVQKHLPRLSLATARFESEATQR